MSRTPTSPPPRFSRTFDLLLSRFPDSADLSADSINSSPTIMASNRYTYQSTSNNDKYENRATSWRSSISSPLCAFCNKAVYPAEEVNAAGQKFHKFCLKCTSCATLLNSGNISEREKKIYCSSCYRRQFGPRGVGRGLATCYLSNIETPPSSPNSNREETDYSSGLTNSDDNSLYKKHSTVSPSSHISSDDDSRYSYPKTSNTIVYTSEVPKRTNVSSTNRQTTSNITNGSAFKMMSISGNICSRCSKTVYSAEEIKAAGKSFHKRCYTCAKCNGSISGGRYSVHDGELYDNNCYQRLFGPKGVGFGIGSGTLSTGI